MLSEWASLKYSDPHIILPQLRKLQVLAAASNLNEHAKNLRTNKLKRYKEGWEATLFCYGIGELLNTTVEVALHESSDYDVIARRMGDGIVHYTPIQIKELVPESLNPETDLNKEISKLTRYPVSNDLVVVVHLNRDGRLDLSKLDIPRLEIAELWLIGATQADQSEWFIAGDLLKSPTIFTFKYPS